MSDKRGPWKLAPYNGLYADNGAAGGDNDVIDEYGRLIAEVTEWDNEGNPNAKLIAAAPEMFDQLQWVTNQLCRLYSTFGKGDYRAKIVAEAIEGNNAAIAKAKGE